MKPDFSFLRSRRVRSRISLRYLQQHPRLSILMLVGIMMGVAVMVAIDIANESASRAFDLSTEAVVGKTTHQISAANGVPDQLYTEMRQEIAGLQAAPVLQRTTVAPDLEGRLITLLGVDPLSESAFRTYISSDNEVPLDILTPFLTQPGSVLISEALAQRFGLQACPQDADPVPNCQLQLEIEGRIQVLSIVGLLAPEDEFDRRAVSDLALTDIATAQELTGALGQLDRIDLILPEGALGEEQFADLQAWLPPSVQLQTVAARTGAIQEMTAAFRVNLTALSLLALLVGLFLIYNTMTFSVVQRRPLFGILRALGMTQAEVFRLVVLEAAILGLIGSALGVLLGVALGQGAVQLVTRSINDLFFVVNVRGLQIPAASLLKGGLVGVIATILAAAPPAWEAGSVSPRMALERSGLEQKTRQAVRMVAFYGLGLLAVGGVILLVPTRNLIVSFGGAFVAIVGAALLTPAAVVAFMRGVTPLTTRIWGLLGRMAPRDVVGALSRTAVAVAALMIAIAVTIGVTLMVGSFRYTVATWLDQVLQGDIYISAPGGSNTEPGPPLDAAVLARVQNEGGVESLGLLRNLMVESPQGPMRLDAIDNYSNMDVDLLLAADGSPADVWQALADGAVLISEPLSNRLGLSNNGGELVLFTPQGPTTFPIAGIYYDYTSPQGAVRMDLAVYRQLWADDAINGMALMLDPGADVDQVTEKLRFDLQDVQQLLIRPQRALRQLSLEIFDRTFIITQAMQLLTTVVAFIGILSTLMALQLERRHQFGILRALGLTGGESFRLILLQSGLMGLVAGILAMPTGLMLALILVYIINKRSFGWTLQLQITLAPFLWAVTIAVIAALLAGAYPAYQLLSHSTARTLQKK